MLNSFVKRTNAIPSICEYSVTSLHNGLFMHVVIFITPLVPDQYLIIVRIYLDHTTSPHYRSFIVSFFLNHRPFEIKIKRVPRTNLFFRYVKKRGNVGHVGNNPDATFQPTLYKFQFKPRTKQKPKIRNNIHPTHLKCPRWSSMTCLMLKQSYGTRPSAFSNP
jgi:hypothetical protein